MMVSVEEAFENVEWKDGNVIGPDTFEAIQYEVVSVDCICGIFTSVCVPSLSTY